MMKQTLKSGKRTGRATSAAAASASAASPADGARILLVDDDERNLLALGQVLKDVAEVVTASSGSEALRYLLRGDFAVVLLDVFMPGMDGYEVASLIRSREHTAHTPIIFLSAVNKETEHLMRGYSMGAVDYVFKPVDPVILQSKVGVFVDLYRMRTQIEAKNRDEQRLREENYRAELERLQMKAELQETRERQAAMLEALPLALFEAALDEGGHLVRRFVGGDLTRIAGSDGAAIESGALQWEERIDPEDRETLRLRLAGVKGASVALEYRWHGSDGTRHFIEQIVASEEGSSDAGWVGTLIDVTERKRLEAQLLQAGKLDAIGQLTGGVAHDFNNLLATVLGGIELIERRVTLGEREQMIVSRMRYAAEKGSELVGRMMAFARKQDLRPVAIPPKRLCHSVRGLVEQTLGGTIALDWECEVLDRSFLADEAQLELALVNLIINARDAMPHGGNIRIFTGSAPDDAVAQAGLPAGDYLQVRVSDEGTGIPENMVARVTEPFFTTKQVGKGTGLGLSMVSGFVQQSNGSLAFETSEGRGTTVVLILPAVRAEPAAEQVGAVKVASQPATEFAVHSILLVDDDESVRSVVAEQLRDLGMRVEVASCAADAFALLDDKTKQFDLLISDLAMPGLNGIQTVSRARELRPEIRTVIMTGFFDSSTPLTAPQGTPVLRKPLQIVDLAAVLT